MPFMTAPPTRPRLTSSTRLYVPSSPERPLSGRVAVSTSPVRSLSSGGYAAALSRPSVSHLASTPVFEPRIIRATTSPTGSGEPGCAPGTVPSQGTPSRPRRPSVRRQSTTTAPAVLPSTPRATAPSTVSPAPSAPTAFQRPSYLEHSALRDLLYTDAPPPNPSGVLADGAVAGTPMVPRMSTPVPVPYPYLRREATPGWGDTDSESNASASPPPIRMTPAPPPPGALLTNPALRLPTRWSEQDRHHLLTVSGDGRELTFYGVYVYLVSGLLILKNLRTILWWRP
jgi:Ran-binding protein 9/10